MLVLAQGAECECKCRLQVQGAGTGTGVDGADLDRYTGSSAKNTQSRYQVYIPSIRSQLRDGLISKDKC